MIRHLEPNWQFLLASSMRRAVWAATPAVVEAEKMMLLNFLSSGVLPTFAALPDEISIECAQMRDDDDDDKRERKCAVIPIIGTMFRYGTLCSYGADEYAAMITAAANSSEYDAIVLHCDSGGGDVRSVAPLLDAINYAKSCKPVVMSADMCGSAAYFVASACDKIFAQNTISSSFGSIGTYTEIIDDDENLKSRGIVRHTIIAPGSPDKNKGYHQAKTGNYEDIQNESLTPINNAFINTVKTNRPGMDESVFTGKMYFSAEAESLGLIDGVKTLAEAVEFAFNLSDVNQFINK